MKTYIPTQEMRTNPLSTKPGGSTVIVKFDGYEVVYENIKRPRAYITKIRKERDDIKAIFVDGELWTK